jgi:glycosyltransferase involved in cell wall biosynthesis
MATADPRAGLVMIGATQSIHGEVDTELAPAIRAQAARDGLADRLFFVESTRAIEQYFRAADAYVLPSIREGLPIALLEAMSSALPCVATRIEGSTDGLVDDRVNGILVAPDAETEMAAAIRLVLNDAGTAARLGAAARRTVLDRYSIAKTGIAVARGLPELDR